MAERKPTEPPFDGGAQPVPERRQEVPKSGRSVVQIVVIALAILVLAAAVLWFAVPFGG